MSRRGSALLLASVLLVGLVVGADFLPVPYVTLQPGPLYDTLGQFRADPTGPARPVISISGARTYPTTGRLALTTVLVDGGPTQQPTLLQAIRAWLDRRWAVLPEPEFYPPNESQQAATQATVQQMEDSQQHALTAALHQLGLPIRPEVSVGQVTAGTPAAGRLRSGDVILAVDGRPVATEAALRAAITARRAGATVRLTIRRDGQVSVLTVGTVAGPGGRPVVGFMLVAGFVSSVRVTFGISANDIGGPSAGLMLALGIVDELTPGGLTGGRFIAGTGTIDDTGAVGPIGGITQKVFAAAAAGATVFLAPADECADAKAAAPASLRVVRVSTLAGAVAALEALRTGHGAVPAC